MVTTKNFMEDTNFRGSGPNMVLVERFTRNSEDTLRYEYTVEDLESFEKPWSVAVEMKKTSDPLLEYACHEGNRAMFPDAEGSAGSRAKGQDHRRLARDVVRRIQGRQRGREAAQGSRRQRVVATGSWAQSDQLRREARRSPEDPMKSLRPSGRVMSRPLPLQFGSQIWSLL